MADVLTRPVGRDLLTTLEVLHHRSPMFPGLRFAPLPAYSYYRSKAHGATSASLFRRNPEEWRAGTVGDSPMTEAQRLGVAVHSGITGVGGVRYMDVNTWTPKQADARRTLEGNRRELVVLKEKERAHVNRLTEAGRAALAQWQAGSPELQGITWLPERVVASGPVTLNRRGVMVVHDPMPFRGMIDLLGFTPEGVPVIVDVKTVAAPAYRSSGFAQHIQAAARNGAWHSQLALYARLLLGLREATAEQLREVRVFVLVIVKDATVPRAKVLPVAQDMGAFAEEALTGIDWLRHDMLYSEPVSQWPDGLWQPDVFPTGAASADTEDDEEGESAPW